MIESVKIGIARVVFWFGYYWYKIFRITPWYSYLSLRKLFYTSNSEFNKKVSERIARENPGYPALNPAGVLGNLTAQDVKFISEQIQREGYYVFPSLLDERTINDLIAMSFATRAKLVPKPSDAEEWGFFERGKARAIKYQYFEGDLVQDPIVQRLLSDTGILAVSQAFLKSKPIIDLISMWWSTSISQKASSEVAQLYHFDMERIKFLKFFFYLTDVDTNTGPHCYIKGSNNGFAKAVRRDGRIQDEEIEKAYTPQDIVEVTGSLVVPTRKEVEGLFADYVAGGVGPTLQAGGSAFPGGSQIN